MGAAERREEVVQPLLVGHVDYGKARAHLMPFALVKQVATAGAIAEVVCIRNRASFPVADLAFDYSK
jgi:hypothetical protein